MVGWGGYAVAKLQEPFDCLQKRILGTMVDSL